MPRKGHANASLWDCTGQAAAAHKPGHSVVLARSGPPAPGESSCRAAWQWMPVSTSSSLAAACWLASLLFTEKHLCSDLRSVGEKSVLVTPQNPLARMQCSAWGPLGNGWALLLQLLLHPLDPAGNKSALPSPSRWDVHCLHFLSLFSALLCSSRCWLTAELQGRQGGCDCTDPCSSA